MSNTFRKYIFQEFQGNGEMIFEDGNIYKGNFQVYLLSAGNLEGSIFLTEFSNDINIRFDSAEKFLLVGELKDKTKFSADNCVMYSLQPYSLPHDNFTMYTARFIINHIKIFDEDRLNNLSKRMYYSSK